MTQSHELEPAYVLHTRHYRDTSLLVDLFTLHHGKIATVARGARNQKSTAKNLLQPFAPLLVSWVGKHELTTLRQVEPSGIPFYLKDTSLYTGLYLNELLLRLSSHFETCPVLFELYQKTLMKLKDENFSVSYLREFERQLLIQLGYGLHFSNEVDSGHAIELDGFYYFTYEVGFIRVSQLELSRESTRKKFSGKAILAIHQGDFSDESLLSEIKELMRVVFAHLLGNKPLKSRELLVQYKKLLA
ncbi:MAG: DNA repair protein RecO [Proteobacteria bacterium]|nr:DNA repair protein RecO [Pseudomonadota bacterium]